MKACGVDDWSEVCGSLVRLKREERFAGKILAIGHIIEDEWFEPAVEFDKMQGEN